MHVELRTEGGLAVFPGLCGTFVCESQGLGEEEARQLAALVEAAGVLAAAAGPSSPPATIVRRGADRRRYVLTVQDGALRRSVTVEDPLTPALAALVAFLRERQRAARARSRAGERDGG